MPGGVAHDIRLSLNNSTAGDTFRQLPYHDLANEITGESDRIVRQLRTINRRMAHLAAAGSQGISSNHCAHEGSGSNGSPKYRVSRATFAVLPTGADGRLARPASPQRHLALYDLDTARVRRPVFVAANRCAVRADPLDSHDGLQEIRSDNQTVCISIHIEHDAIDGHNARCCSP